MKICAITMTYRDYWALGQWYSHYGKALGYENLYVIAHGHDQMISKICPQASVISIPRDNLEKFDAKRMQVMNAIQASLGELFDWVIQTDADELVCLDPDRYSSFADLFIQHDAPALFSLGMDLVETDDDAALIGEQNVLNHRTAVSICGNYSKAWAVSKPLPLQAHGVYCGRKETQTFPYILPDGVFLLHLKYANREALHKANNTRKSVSNELGGIGPAAGWRKPHMHRKRFFAKFDTMNDVAWKEALPKAYAIIREIPHRLQDKGVVRAPFYPYLVRTTLPEWFKNT